MKKIVVAIVLLIVLIVALLVLLPSKNKDSIPLNALDSVGFRELVGIDSDMSVFYLLNGKYDGVEQSAYLNIAQEYGKDGLIATIMLPQNNKAFDIPLDSKVLNLALDENKMLILSGLDNGAEFKFHQDSNAALNQIHFVDSKISNKAEIDDGEFGKREITYEGRIRKPIILNAKIDNIDLLNKSMSDSKDLSQLRENLDSTLKANMADYNNNYGFVSNAEFIDEDSVGYIDDNILEIDTFSYQYTGGAHGNRIKSMQLYDIKSGDKIPSKIEDVFDINDDNRDEFLALLGSSLENEKDKLFEESLPLSVMPNSFFLSQNGIIFVWNTYEIAPYAAGSIEITISTDKLKKWIKEGALFITRF